MSEQSVDQLLALAKQKTASFQQDRDERAEDARMDAVNSQVQKIYADREDQIRREGEIKAINEQNMEEHRKWREYQAEKKQLEDNVREAEAGIAENHTPEEVKAIYRQVIDQAKTQSAALDEKIKQAEANMNAGQRAKEEHNVSIDQTTQEAKELMGYDKEKRERFEPIAEYVQKMRELKVQEKEVISKFNIDALVEEIWKEIPNQNWKTKRSNGYEGYVTEADLNRYAFEGIGPRSGREQIFQSPLVVKQIREKLFAKIKELEPQARAEDWKGKTTDTMQKGLQTEVVLTARNEKNERAAATVFLGGWGNLSESYHVEAEKLPYLHMEQLTEDQKAVIQEAIADPGMPMQELKMKLGFKQEQETVARIQESAIEENQEFNRQKELNEIKAKIERLSEKVAELEEQMHRHDQRMAVLEKNLEYSVAERNTTNKINEAVYLEQDLKKAQNDLERLPKNFLGWVKDKQKQQGLIESIAKMETELLGKQKAAEEAKAEQERIKAGLGADFMKDYYDAGHQLKNVKTSIEFDRSRLNEVKAEINKLEQRRSALEK